MQPLRLWTPLCIAIEANIYKCSEVYYTKYTYNVKSTEGFFMREQVQDFGEKAVSLFDEGTN